MIKGGYVHSNRYDSIRAIRWLGNGVELLDQRRLPGEASYLVAKSATEVAAAIRDMVVRGAPAIGISAAYAVVLASGERFRSSPASWKQDLEVDLATLRAARPTAVNLAWALDRMLSHIPELEGDPVPTLAREAKRIHDEDVAANYRMGELGAALIEPGSGVLTHCNTGSLATGGYGTALGVIRTAFARGAIERVFADETRPWLQGARLTAWELVEEGIPVSLIADSAAAYAMRRGKVSWVIVGADRVAANGDVANKIGTYSLALSARYHGIGFMVVAPTSSIDLAATDGSAIPIEARGAEELLRFAERPVAATGAGGWNPVFDVTPAELVSVLVTERGVVTEPTEARIASLMSAGSPAPSA